MAVYNPAPQYVYQGRGGAATRHIYPVRTRVRRARKGWGYIQAGISVQYKYQQRGRAATRHIRYTKEGAGLQPGIADIILRKGRGCSQVALPSKFTKEGAGLQPGSSIKYTIMLRKGWGCNDSITKSLNWELHSGGK